MALPEQLFSRIKNKSGCGEKFKGPRHKKRDDDSIKRHQKIDEKRTGRFRCGSIDLAAKTEEIKSAFIGSKMLEKICKLMEKYRFSDKANQLAKTIPSESFRQCLQLKFSKQGKQVIIPSFMAHPAPAPMP